MDDDNTATRTKGHYFGTEINEKWWKRYAKNNFLARGTGEYWFDDENFYFRRLLNKNPIAIPLSQINGFKVGKWHAGQWGGGKPILKILWTPENRQLSSGFLLSKYRTDLDKLVSELETIMKQN